MFSKVIGGFNKPGPHFCRGVAKAFGMPAEEVFRLAGLLPPKPTAPARRPLRDSRRIIYEIDGEALVLDLWRRLAPDDQEIVRDLMERLAPLNQPKIIGAETEG